MPSPKTGMMQKSYEQQKEDRRATALRENLKKRKLQAEQRKPDTKEKEE